MKYVLIGMALVLSISAGFVLMSDSDESDAAVVASGTCGTNLNWEYDDATKTLTISGTGTTMTDYTQRTAPWYTDYHGNITSIVWNTPNLTYIGAWSFYELNKVTTTDLPNSLVTIGESAFRSSKLLNLSSIPDSVTTIMAQAFNGTDMSSLSSFPASLTTLGNNVFQNTKLTLTTIPTGLTIGSGLFYGVTTITSFTIPSGYTEIPESMFIRCTNLQTITMADTVTTIGRSAFSNCTSLTNVDFPDNLTTIELWAFQNCSNLGVVDIPISVTSIGNSAFEGSVITELIINQSITYPSSNSWPTSISKITIQGSDSPASISTVQSRNTPWYIARANLTEINLDNVEVLVQNTFLNMTNAYDLIKGVRIYSDSGKTVRMTAEELSAGNVAYVQYPTASGTCGTNLNWNLWETELEIYGSGTTISSPTPANWGGHNAEIENVVFPSGITSIGDSSFGNCTNLALTSLPDGLTSIDNYAFRNCTNLALTSLPDGLTSIGNQTFDACHSLISMSIPSTVVSIGHGVFQNCANLASVEYNPVNCMLSGTIRTFNGCTSLTEITMGESVSVVPNYLFATVSALKTINFNAVDCHDFTTDNQIFYGTAVDTIIFGDGVTRVPAHLCKDMTATLESVSFNDDLNEIGIGAFQNCSNMVVLALPNVETIEANAFEGCTEVAIQTLPVSLTTVGEQAFKGCTGIDHLLVPKGFAAEIGTDAFDGCTNLTEILNLSDLDIVAGAETHGKIGFYATTVGNSFDDVAMVQDKEFIQHTIEPKEDAASKLLRVLPILMVVGILLSIIYMMHLNRVKNNL